MIFYHFMRKHLLPALAAVIFCALLVYLAGLLHQLPFWPFTLASGQHPIETVLLAMLLGMLCRMALHIPQSLLHVSRAVGRYSLYTAIIMLGARLDWRQVAHLPWQVLGVIVIAVCLCLLAGLWLARCLKIPRVTGYLVTVGTAICGTAAIAAVSPQLAAAEEEVALSVAAINLLGTVAIFLFPLLGHLLRLANLQYAVWVGTSVQAVAQTTAAAFAFSAQAGVLGTLVKLTRVLLLAPVLLFINLVQPKPLGGSTAAQARSMAVGHPAAGAQASTDPSSAALAGVGGHAASPQQAEPKAGHRNQYDASDATHSCWRWQTLLPPFIIGFILMMSLNSMGWLQHWQWSGYSVWPRQWLQQSSQFFMAMALVAIGLRTHFPSLLQTGSRALLFALLLALVLAGFSYLILMVF